MTLPNTVNLNINAEEYLAGVLISAVDRHNMLTLWRDTYLMTLSNEVNPTNPETQAIAASAADNACASMSEFVDTLDDANEDTDVDVDPPVIVPGRAS